MSTPTIDNTGIIVPSALIDNDRTANTANTANTQNTTSNQVMDGIDLSQYIYNDAFLGKGQWTGGNNKTLDKYINKSRVYQALYNDTFYYYSRWESALSIPLIIIGFITIVLQTVTTIFSNNAEVNQIVSIVSLACGVITGTIIGIQKKTDFNVTASKCQQLAMDFSDYSEKLTILKDVPPEQRANPYTIILNFQTEYQKLKRNTINDMIPQYILNSVIARYALNNPIDDIEDEFNVYSNQGSKLTSSLKIQPKAKSIRLSRKVGDKNV